MIIRPVANLTMNGIYHLEVSYDGELREDNLGFYRSSYSDGSGKTVYLATTQFENVEARSAFPCYDEPQIRTPFIISITYGKNYTAVSNMPDVRTIDSDIDGYLTREFAESPPIQTYLIAFIISDFKYVENGNQRVFAKPDSVDIGDADLALKYGQEILTKFNEYLGVNYFLPKMDQFALPDFDAGAMENFGLVTYREEYLLHNSLTDTTQQKENVLTIISHEFAHQWHGDLVAPEWWSYLWLNEGFATLYEFYLISLIYDSDRLMDSFLLNVVQPALEYDGYDVRPMSYYVESPDEIDELFDLIAYEKSGSVLRMMQNAIGDDIWRKGMKNYLDNRSLKEATPDDLHAGLQLAVNETGYDIDIAKIMLSWETQSGYPVVHVNLNGSTLKFTQERFLYEKVESTSDSIWYVPINYITASDSVIVNTKPNFWMNKEKSVTLSREQAPRSWNNDDWIIANLQQGYYYRVNYDDSLWQVLIKQLDNCHSKIDLHNRGKLIDDSLNLARAGLISYDIPLSILKHLKEETDYLPWASAYGDLLLLNRWLSGLTMHTKYQKFIRKLVEPLYEQMKLDVMENEHKFNRYSRKIAINLACQFGHESCLETTKSKLNDANIHPDMQEAIYSNGLREADEETYDKVMEKMLNSKNQAERTLLIRALGCAQNEDNLKKLLNLAIDNDEKRIRLQEKYRIFSSWPNAGIVGVKVIMEFIEESYEDINEISPSLVNSILSNAAGFITSDDLSTQFTELLEFLITKSMIDDSHKVVFLSMVNDTKIWQDKNVQNIEEWLDLNGATSLVVSIFVLTFSIIVKIFF